MRRVVPWAVALMLFGPVLFAQHHDGSHDHHSDRVAVPSGAFAMGNDTAGEQDERPRHTVHLHAFRIDRTEVSRSRWQQCQQAHACDSPRSVGVRFEDPRQPVVGVSWNQARAFCTWASGRLPTEEEWEKAARGTDGRTYAWGEETPTEDRAVFGRHQSSGHPDPVGTHPHGASPYGALDMTGNVWEWTESPYDPYAYRHPDHPATCETALASLTDLRTRGIQGFTGTNPLPRTCERVLRGGAWNYGAGGLRVTNRVHHGTNFQLAVAGFRCVSDSN